MIVRSIIITFVMMTCVLSNREILKRQGDYFLRLQNRDGNLVMDEGDIPRDVPLKAPMYIRKKRIAHARDFQKFLKEQDKYEFLNDVNVDDINKMDVNVETLDRRDLYPASSDFVGIQSMLDSNSLNPPAVPFAGMSGLGDIYGRDTQQCLQKYLCEVMGTSQPNLLMEEAALIAMMQSQAEIRSALRTSLTPEEGIRRLRRSVPDIDLALKEAVQVEKVCSRQFPYCKISRIDILRVYKEQKESFCSLPMPYGM